MKKIKQVLVIYEDGSSIGYNRNMFIQVLKRDFNKELDEGKTPSFPMEIRKKVI